jgi:acetylornithine deacetylase/succinyl-diaminopimelate desuccinylase-like protein
MRLQSLIPTLSAHPILGKTTVAPTVIEVDTTSINVTPAWTRVLLDFRTATESTRSLVLLVQGLATEWPHSISDAISGTTLTADSATEDMIAGFYTPKESPEVHRTRELVAMGMGRLPALTSYRFATDGRHFAEYGIPVLGFSPAEEHQAHIADESISLSKIEENLRGLAPLLLEY